MKIFVVSEYSENEDFVKAVDQVLSSRSKEELLSAFKSLDLFVSTQVGIDSIPIVIGGINDAGEFKWEPFSIFINEKIFKIENMEELLAIYFHEKRHHFQYLCYMENNPILGKMMIGEIKNYLMKEDVAPISKTSVFDGLYGYYGRLIERDAYVYGCDCMLQLCEIGEKWWEQEQIVRMTRYYTGLKKSFWDHEFMHWVEQHKIKFEVLKRVEEGLLREIKEMLCNEDFSNKELKKLVFSKRVFDCLNKKEKQKLLVRFVLTNETQVAHSERELDKVIKKRVNKEMKKNHCR